MASGVILVRGDDEGCLNSFRIQPADAGRAAVAVIQACHYKFVALSLFEGEEHLVESILLFVVVRVNNEVPGVCTAFLPNPHRDLRPERHVDIPAGYENLSFPRDSRQATPGEWRTHQHSPRFFVEDKLLGLDNAIQRQAEKPDPKQYAEPLSQRLQPLKQTVHLGLFRLTRRH
jgi:hypothetical protein